MSTEKDKWINEVIDSANRIQRAQPQPFLYTRIKASVENIEAPISTRKIWQTAFGVIILVVMNIFGIASVNTEPENEQEITVVAEDLELEESDAYFTYQEQDI